MERVNELIVNAYIQKTCQNGEFAEDRVRQEKIRYMLILVLSEIEKLVVIFALSLLIGRGWEFFFVTATFGLTRVYLGGSHEGGFFSCLIHSTCIFASVYILSWLIPLEGQLWIPVLVFILHCVLLYCYAPIPSRAKPHYSEKRRRMFRRRGAVAAAILGVVMLLIPAEISCIAWTVLMVDADAFYEVIRRKML